MIKHSRRKFLKQLGAVSALLATGRTSFSLPGFLFENADQEFDMLIVGDSLIAGQGLLEKDKFYSLTRDWLQNEAFQGNRKVNLKNKSHSGSRIYLPEYEVKALRDAEKDPGEFFHQEVNFSFPSMKVQLDAAKTEYVAEGKSVEDIDLVMLSGGLTNLNSSYILDPYRKNKSLRRAIPKYCDEMMFRFLTEGAEIYPNALFVVIGYFPMVSNKSDTGKVFNTVLELYKYPGFTKPLMNNLLTKQFFKILHNNISKRSRIWTEESTKSLRNAVNRTNSKFGKQRAVFVNSPITEDRCFETKNTLLFRMGKKGRSEDPLYDIRKRECAKAFESIETAKLEYKKRFCELAGIGHPNVEGSKAYAEAISKTLSTETNLLKSFLTKSAN